MFRANPNYQVRPYGPLNRYSYRWSRGRWEYNRIGVRRYLAEMRRRQRADRMYRLIRDYNYRLRRY